MEICTMPRITYSLQFKGNGTPGSEDGKLSVSAKASGNVLRTSIGAAGIDAVLEPAAGEATFHSDVQMMGDTNFDERGRITFGSAGSVLFSTVGRGVLGPSPEKGLTHGSVIWKVDSGDGKFAGATGLITSNFVFNEAMEVTDTHLGIIFLP
jgi:hypothetical protein